MKSINERVKELRNLWYESDLGGYEYGRYQSACAKNMPAVLDALEQVTRERDAALVFLAELRTVAENTPCNTVLWRIDGFKRNHPHLFDKENPDAKR